MDHINQQHLQTIAHIDRKVSGVGASVKTLTGAFTQLTTGAAAVRLSVSWPGSIGTVPNTASQPSSVPSTYKMVRSLKTVHQVWQEWSVGIHGGPAVRNLEEIHGSLWRNTSADKRFFFDAGKSSITS
ncbi:Short-chain dehydrogenase [Phytophthora megakarya]|uniref:Short-chain dehydrogenase n=1 Tax=Phytophthora megakarya TaxID=4795 RepID=A0A225X5B8_9STRA|nr:Short-chain dehydrogenase [Phytophthora megakarya]